MTMSRHSRIALSPALPARRALAALALLLLHGCTGGSDGRSTTPVDTCNDGDTFQELHIVNGLETIDGKGAVRIGWGLGAGRARELPPDYFAAVTVTEGAATATLTGQHEITVVLDDLEVPPPSPVSFSLAFPDRRDYIDCIHPASPDTYLLHVDLHFDAAGALTHAELTEDFQPGYY